MSDDLREQIARALARLAGKGKEELLDGPPDLPWPIIFRRQADAVLAVVQPVIEQAEREVERLTLFQRSELTAAEARVATLEAALGVKRNYWQTRSHLARTKTEEVMAEYHLDLIDAALVEQEATPPDDDSGECLHPADGVKWNPDNGVVQCHRCGEVVIAVGLTDALVALGDEYGPRGVVEVARLMFSPAAAPQGEPEPCPTCGSTGPTWLKTWDAAERRERWRICPDPWHQEHHR